MNDNDTNVSRAKRMSMWLVIFIGAIIVVLFFVFVVYELYVMSNPVCAHSGCDEPPESGSEYCAVHKPKSHSYYSSYTTTKATKATTYKKQTTTYKSTKRTTKKATTTKKTMTIMMCMTTMTPKIFTMTTMTISGIIMMRRIIGRSIIE